MRKVMLWAAVIIAAVVVYAAFDPSASGWFPKCPFLMITGWQCPGCGSQRALHALLHLDMAGAWQYNAALVVSLPLLIILTTASALKRRWPKLYFYVYHPIVIWSILAAIIAWWIGRNIL